MDKELRTECKRLIGELYLSNSFITHTDDWRKMREAAEMLQTLLNLVDDLECSHAGTKMDGASAGGPAQANAIGSSPIARSEGQVVECFSTPGRKISGDVGSKPTLPATKPRRK